MKAKLKGYIIGYRSNPIIHFRLRFGWANSINIYLTSLENNVECGEFLALNEC